MKMIKTSIHGDKVLLLVEVNKDDIITYVNETLRDTSFNRKYCAERIAYRKKWNKENA